jgi:hypothetical protein
VSAGGSMVVCVMLVILGVSMKRDDAVISSE